MEAEKSSYYVCELDKMQEVNDSLAKEVSFIQDQLTQALQSERELRERIHHFEKVANEVKEGALDMEEEKSRQINYLEKENLNLLNELRSTKEKLKNIFSYDRNVKKYPNDDTALTTSLDDIIKENDERKYLSSDNSSTIFFSDIKTLSPIKNAPIGSDDINEKDEDSGECKQS